MQDLSSTPVGVGRRLAQLLFGLVVMGLGVAMLLAADLGAAPWDVLHQGIASRTSLSVGAAVIVVGLLVFAAWVPLQLRPRSGTILNAVLMGPMIDLGLMVLPQPSGLPSRIAFLLLGTLLFGFGAGLYLAAGLGAGPRDGLMTGLAARGLPLRWVRTGLEVGALVIGWALGGTVGVGTLVVALALGHIIQPVMAKTAPVRTSPRALVDQIGSLRLGSSRRRRRPQPFDPVPPCSVVEVDEGQSGLTVVPLAQVPGRFASSAPGMPDPP